MLAIAPTARHLSLLFAAASHFPALRRFMSFNDG
jgi:hypothetical protein